MSESSTVTTPAKPVAAVGAPVPATVTAPIDPRVVEAIHVLASCEHSSVQSKITSLIGPKPK